MKVYVVQEIMLGDNDLIGGAVVGVYTNRWLAKLAVNEMSSDEERNGSVVYDIVAIPLDTFPINADEYEEAIESLIKAGLVEALVGEDGLFYYIPTELGKKEGKKIVKRLKKDDKEDKGGD